MVCGVSERIEAACSALERGELGTVLELCAGFPADDRVGKSLALTARGLLAEQSGAAEDAEACFMEAEQLGVPYPVLLHQWAAFFKRNGRFGRAYSYYSLLELSSPGISSEFLADLPPHALAQYAPWAIATLVASPRPSHWHFPPIKKALRQRLGTAGAATAFAKLAGMRPGTGMLELQLESLQSYASRAGVLHHVASAGRELVLPAPPVYDGDGPAALPASTREVFVCVVEDGIVSSKSDIVVVGEHALMDFQGDELASPYEHEVDPIVFERRGDTLSVLIDGSAAAEAPIPEALSLVGINSYNFGHLIHEYLPRLLMCLAHPAFAEARVPILVDEQIPSQQLEAIALFAGPDHPVITLPRGQSRRVERLWLCSSPTFFPIPEPGVPFDQSVLKVDGAVLTALYERYTDAYDAFVEHDSPKRIFLTRKDEQHRALINRVEVEEWFRSKGFEVYDFGDLSLGRQLALTRGADLIVGADGSSLLMAYLARPGTAVGFLCNRHLDDKRLEAAMFESGGQHWSLLVGADDAKAGPKNRYAAGYAYLADYRIDLDQLPAFLAHLEAMRVDASLVMSA